MCICASVQFTTEKFSCTKEFHLAAHASKRSFEGKKFISQFFLYIFVFFCISKKKITLPINYIYIIYYFSLFKQNWYFFGSTHTHTRKQMLLLNTRKFTVICVCVLYASWLVPVHQRVATCTRNLKTKAGLSLPLGHIFQGFLSSSKLFFSFHWLWHRMSVGSFFLLFQIPCTLRAFH